MNEEKQILPDVVDEEVRFWISFIAWWEDKHDKPATHRMLDALASAKEKLTKAEVSASTSIQPLM